MKKIFGRPGISLDHPLGWVISLTFPLAMLALGAFVAPLFSAPFDALMGR